jgi:hypothetical protein
MTAAEGQGCYNPIDQPRIAQIPSLFPFFISAEIFLLGYYLN